MTLSRKSNRNRGFTLAELIFVVAIIAVLVGIAFIFVNPKDLSYVEYNRSAEAIATAAQNRLTEIRNTGDMSTLRTLGKQAIKTGETVTTSSSEEESGGYRYVFNYTVNADGTVTKNDLSYILPFGAIDTDLAKNYIVIGFQSDTGMVREVFYSPEPIGQGTVESILQYQGDEAKRKAENVGYYMGSVYDSEVAFANLPTPQLTITNYEELTLSIYLPEVKQLDGKKLGILISLSDEDGESYSSGKNFSFVDTAIYSTFSLGDSTSTGIVEGDPIIQTQEIKTGETYTLLLDTIKTVASTDMQKDLGTSTNTDMPKGVFEDWAKKSKSYDEKIFLLGDNSVITVTVYCLYDPSVENYDEHFPIDPTFMPRSASVTFNGWFNHYGSSTVDIACGRHLQNLGKLAQMREVLTPYLPKLTIDGKEYVYGKDELPRLTDGQTYSYGDYNYGMASTYTAGSSHGDPVVEYEDVAEKYKYRDHVKSISKANQVNAIDFNCDEWKENGEPIAFTPINLPRSFYYYGNYLTISHLYVDAPFYAGLFGYAYHQRMYDILLVNPSVTSQMPAHLAELYEMGVGALIGTSRDSSHINNCQVYMTQEKDTDGNGKYFPDKYRVTGTSYVGGLIGFCEDEHIENCSASVYTGYQKDATKNDQPISSRFVGGLIGAITGDSKLKNCYAAGNLSGEFVGGLVGLIREDSDPSGDDYRIQTCYTAGHIEYAAQEAAGILGYISELSGNAKSAVSIFDNYCAIIYGIKGADGKYSWSNGAPIYGTFKGDGFEWIHTDDIAGYSDVYLTSKYAGDTFFAGAIFANDNKNYYIAQKGISYSNSSYFTAMKEEVQGILDSIQADSTDLSSDVEKAKNKIFYLKKLQTLEDLKRQMENIIYEMDNETGKDKKGNPYTDGGYSSHGTDIYLDTNDAEIKNKDNGISDNDVKLTAQQALHAIYDGTYTDSTGATQTVTITDQDHNIAKKEEGAIDDFTFMGFYNALKGAYTKLAENENDAEAKKTLKFVFGDHINEEFFEEKNSDGGTDTYSFYKDGRFYRSFYVNMLYRLFDKCKDYYQNFEPLKDETGNQMKDEDGNKLYISEKNGELIYRHFRDDLCAERFLEILCDLGMTDDARDLFLLRAKSEAMQKTIDALTANLEIYKAWQADEKDKDGNTITHMKDQESTATTKTNTAITAVKALKELFDNAIEKKTSYTTETLEGLMKTASKALNDLKNFFDENKNTVDHIGKDDDGKWVDGDMRNFRDAIAAYLRDVELCAATANSGVEEAIDELATKLSENKDKTSSVETFKEEIDTYLGSDWNSADSGHNIENSEQLRNAARGYVDGVDTGDDSDREENLGFMYDYNNHYSGQDNPYEDKSNPYADHYVDEDNKIYNNVFPYEESEYTHYYPFPFVFGRDVEDKDEDSKREEAEEKGEDFELFHATFVLFHYGDWLTQDLWASDDPTISALDIANAQMTVMYTELTAAQTAAGNGGSTGTIKNTLKSVVDAIQSCQNSLKDYSSKDNAAQKSLLSSIRTTISSWLGENGAFTKLVEECEKHDNKAISADVVEKIENYQNQLQDLVDQINALTS